ncbi:MAG: hypothetical protein CML20_09415 [Rheinheimera sp.]|nr:hypothetical protein [Rheinheimera sp.]
MFDYTPRIDALELGLLECTQRIESVEQALAEPSQPEVDPGGAAEMTMVDDQGNTNVMVRVPKFSYQDVNQSILDRTGVDLQLGTGTPTMFLKNGVEINEVYIAKYLASAGASGGCSVVGDAAPMTNVDYDTAKALCKNKGAGWHMMSIHEWAAVALWSFANGTEPRGNTDYGRSHESTIETAVRVDNKTPGDRSGTGATKTGTGPQAWSHDGTSLGIADLVGNVYEWLDQMSLIEGQITTTLDNDPDAAEQSWVKHSAFLDSQTASKSGSAGSPVLNSAISNRNGSVGDDTSNGGYATNEHFAKIAQSPTYQKMELLRRLVIESASQTNVKGSIYCRNYGARFPLRGGHWYIGSDAGLGALTLIYARSGAHSVFGFRPAFFA